MQKLFQQICQPVSSGEKPLEEEQLLSLLDQLNRLWILDEEKNNIYRQFDFNNFYETMAFVNAAAWVAHQQDHHPEMLIAYNFCKINYTTHSINGLSLNDFICAARINEITKK